MSHLLCSSTSVEKWSGVELLLAGLILTQERHPLSGKNSARIGCEYSSIYSAIIYRLGEKRVHEAISKERE